MLHANLIRSQTLLLEWAGNGMCQLCMEISISNFSIAAMLALDVLGKFRENPLSKDRRTRAFSGISGKLKID